MQMEMEAGGLLFFDLFVAICNHMVRTLHTHTPAGLMTLLFVTLSSYSPACTFFTRRIM